MSMTTSEYEGIANGTAVSVPPTDRAIVINVNNQPVGATRPRASAKTVWVNLADDGEYANHQVLVKTRYPERVSEELGSGQFGRMRDGLREVVLEHNGWLDPDTGEPLPPAAGTGSDDFWESLSQPEILLILRAVTGEQKKVFASLLEMKSS